MMFVAVLPLALGRRHSGAWWLRPWLFAAAVLLCTAAFHWPAVLDNQELGDPDESQAIAAAITLSHDPLYYRSVDGTTHGPIDDLPLAALATLGVRIDYQVAHAVALCLSLAGVLATWFTLRHLFGDSVSRLGILPLATAFAFCDFDQFLHYSTEQCPVALVAIACCCMAYAWNPLGRLDRPLWLAGCGLALGAVPFAKLQGGPIALFVAFAGVILIGATSSASWRSRLTAAGILTAGGLLIPAGVLFGIWFWGQWGEFTRNYVEGNLFYLSVRLFPWSEAPAHFFTLVHLAPGLQPFMLPGAVFVALMGVGIRPVLQSWPHRMALFSLLLLLVSAVTAMAPGRNVFHYLHFLFFPAALCTGCFLGVRWQALEAGARPVGSRPWVPFILALLLVGICIWPQVTWRAKAPYPYGGLYSAGRSVLAVSEPAREIMRHSKPGDCLAIWGYTPRLWVETGLWQGTRDGNTIRQVETSGLQWTLQQRYLRDLVRNRPPVFVDAVGEGNFMGDRISGGHEQFPQIAAYITSEYRFIRGVDGMRVYVRRDLP